MVRYLIFIGAGRVDFVGVAGLGCRAMEELHVNLYFTLQMDTTGSTSGQGKSGQVGRREEGISGGRGQVAAFLYDYGQP